MFACHEVVARAGDLFMQFFPLVPFLTTRWKIAGSIAAIGLSLVVVQGCSNSTDKKEAETPKYQVADEKASSQPKLNPKVTPNRRC